MRHRKVIVGALLLIIFAGLSISGYWYAKRPVLAWKVLSIRPIGYYSIQGAMEDCWCADIEVTNLTSSLIIVDWIRDKSAFQVDGRWEDLGIGALMPTMRDYEATVFQLIVPRRAQACRLLIHYEHGPLWRTADDFLKVRGVMIWDNFLIPAMTLNLKLPGHFRRLDIEVKLPASSSKAGEANGPHKFSLHWAGSSRSSLVSMGPSPAAASGQ